MEKMLGPILMVGKMIKCIEYGFGKKKKRKNIILESTWKNSLSINLYNRRHRSSDAGLSGVGACSSSLVFSLLRLSVSLPRSDMLVSLARPTLLVSDLTAAAQSPGVLRRFWSDGEVCGVVSLAGVGV